MSRGDRREEIFRDDVDRQDFLKTLAEICQKTEFALRRGWCLGSAAFRQELLERMEGDLEESHAGELRRESAAVRAERIIAEELRRQGWRRADLAQRRKSDPVKLALAARLKMGTRQSTTTRLQEFKRRRQTGCGFKPGLSRRAG